MNDFENPHPTHDSQPLNIIEWDIKRIQDPSKNIHNVNFLGRECTSLTVFPGDRQIARPNSTPTERTELGEKRDDTIPFGTPVKYSFDIALPADFVISNNRLVLAQWKHTNSDQSPPVSLRYQNNQLIVCIKNDAGNTYYRFDYDLRNRWTKLEAELLLTTDDNSKVRIISNNQEIFNFTGRATFENEEPFSEFHIGLYRDAVNYPGTIYLANYKREIGKAK